MIAIPNLYFNGDCEKALHLYTKVFKGKITALEYYRDTDRTVQTFQEGEEEPAPLSDTEEGYVYHAEMTIGNQKIYLSDSLNQIPQGTNLSIGLAYEYDEEMMEAYSLLSDRGTAIRPLTNRTGSRSCASVVDRYGICWELMKLR